MGEVVAVRLVVSVGIVWVRVRVRVAVRVTASSVRVIVLVLVAVLPGCQDCVVVGDNTGRVRVGVNTCVPVGVKLSEGVYSSVVVGSSCGVSVKICLVDEIVAGKKGVAVIAGIST